MAVAVGDPISASLWNANVGVAKPHVEYTSTSASVATATVASIGTMSVDATTSNTTGTALATISGNTLTIASDGVYDLSFYAALNGAVTANSPTYVQVSDGTNTWKVPATGTTSSQWGGAGFAGVRLPTGTVLTFQFFHTSAANRVLTLRTVLTRQGSY